MYFERYGMCNVKFGYVFRLEWFEVVRQTDLVVAATSNYV